jgi:hypothetical protein
LHIVSILCKALFFAGRSNPEQFKGARQRRRRRRKQIISYWKSTAKERAKYKFADISL